MCDQGKSFDVGGDIVVLRHISELFGSCSAQSEGALGPVPLAKLLGSLRGQIATCSAEMKDAVASEVVANSVHQLSRQSVKIFAWWCYRTGSVSDLYLK